MRKYIENLGIRRVTIGILGLILLTGLAVTQTAEKQSESSFNRNDAMFMNMMIVHHDQAIEMAELSENRTSNENILELSDNISEAQRAENRQMREWMNQLGYEAGNHHAMAGMASEDEMQQLRSSNGSEYNQLFAELMIKHHQGGISMAQNFYNSGQNTELREMQGKMIEAQQTEIEKMRRWREEDQL